MADSADSPLRDIGDPADDNCEDAYDDHLADNSVLNPNASERYCAEECETSDKNSENVGNRVAFASGNGGNQATLVKRVSEEDSNPSNPEGNFEDGYEDGVDKGSEAMGTNGDGYDEEGYAEEHYAEEGHSEMGYMGEREEDSIKAKKRLKRSTEEDEDVEESEGKMKRSKMEELSEEEEGEDGDDEYNDDDDDEEEEEDDDEDEEEVEEGMDGDEKETEEAMGDNEEEDEEEAKEAIEDQEKENVIGKGKGKGKGKGAKGKSPLKKRGGKAKEKKGKNMRRNIKNVMTEKDLDTTTKTAQAEEEERLRRLNEQRKTLQQALLQQIHQRQQQQQQQPQQQHLYRRPPPPLKRQPPQAAPDVVDLSSDDDDDDNESQTVIKPSMGGPGPGDIAASASASDSSDSDIQCLSGVEDEPEDEAADDPNNCGLHVDDRVNVANEDGLVQVNMGQPDGEDPVYLAPQLSRVVKPHQIGGIRFLYDNIIESKKRFAESKGFGCILAHSMGLGKTIQLVSFCDVFLRNTPARHIICIVPINTLQNWLSEFNQWIPLKAEGSFLSESGEVRPRNFQVFVLNDTLKNLDQRSKVIAQWHKVGGVLLMGYELYRLLANKKPKAKKKSKKQSANNGPVCIDIEEEDRTKGLLDDIHASLVNPGPDLIICDEGHRIKNSHASISQALKSIKTRRRVVLTGYPLQNNLIEYWCMVDFVRPDYLGSKTEFSNMFERPIQNGQCVDSTPRDARLMRHRAHVLHNMLKGFVQRRGHAVLQKSLPPKQEHVLLLRLTPVQRDLYKRFLDDLMHNKSVSNPLKAFAVCCKIWNHPDVLYNFMRKKEAAAALEDWDLDIDELTPGGQKGSAGKKKKAASASAQIQPPTLEDEYGFNPFAAIPTNSKRDEISYDWANGMLTDYVPGLLENSSKFTVFFALLEETILAGDRLLLFSQSLLTLNLLEEFLQERIIPTPDNPQGLPDPNADPEDPASSSSERYWCNGLNYFRLDGSTQAQERERLINQFNADPSIPLFIVSTRAGSLGINLVGANRVVVLDASWNPCHDSQAVCRVYRYGQPKCSHIYRLVTDNSIEKKIYDRQVNKQGMADRVVDEQNPDNHLSSKDINHLICDDEDDPPIKEGLFKSCAKDGTYESVLTNVIERCEPLFTKEPFRHESLLIDRKDKKLSRAEKRLAEQTYRLEKESKLSYTRPSYAAFYPKDGGSLSNLNQPGSNGYKRNRYEPQPPYPASQGYGSGGVPLPGYYRPPLMNPTNPNPPGYNPNVPSTSTLMPPFPSPVPNARSYLPNGRPLLVPSPDATPWLSRSPLHHPESPPNGSGALLSNGQAHMSLNPPPALLPNGRLDLSMGRDGQATPTKQFPVEALAKQGVVMQELKVPKDMLIPANQPGQAPIQLRAGQEVMVIRTPKGIYLRMGENIVKVRLPPGLLPEPQRQVPVRQLTAPGEVVTLDSSDEESEPSRGQEPSSSSSSGGNSNSRQLLELVAAAASSKTDEAPAPRSQEAAQRLSEQQQPNLGQLSPLSQWRPGQRDPPPRLRPAPPIQLALGSRVPDIGTVQSSSVDYSSLQTTTTGQFSDKNVQQYPDAAKRGEVKQFSEQDRQLLDETLAEDLEQMSDQQLLDETLAEDLEQMSDQQLLDETLAEDLKPMPDQEQHLAGDQQQMSDQTWSE